MKTLLGFLCCCFLFDPLWVSSPDDMDIANKSLWQSSLLSYKACRFSQFFCVLGDWVLSRNKSSFIVIWVFSNYRTFFWFAAVQTSQPAAG